MLQQEQADRARGAAPAAAGPPAVPLHGRARTTRDRRLGRHVRRAGRGVASCSVRSRDGFMSESVSFDDIVEDRHIVVCCGTGGVGKTTVAAVLRGRRRRAGAGTRSSSRSIPRNGSPTRSGSTRCRTPRTRSTARALGSRRATPRRADGCPRSCSTRSRRSTTSWPRYAADDDQTQRILANRFYRNVFDALSGTQEYMAMEKLLRAAREGRLRPHRRRHAADTPRARLPRRAAAAHAAARQPDLPDADDADRARTCAWRAPRCRRSCAPSRGWSAPR